jgi:hypothetical protein
MARAALSRCVSELCTWSEGDHHEPALVKQAAPTLIAALNSSDSHAAAKALINLVRTPRSRELIRTSGCVPLLVAVSCDEQQPADAAKQIARLLRDIADCRAGQDAAAQGIPFLAARASSSDLAMAAAAAGALSALAVNHRANQDAIAECMGIDNLVKSQLHTRRANEATRLAAEALQHLARDHLENARRAVRCGAIQHLVALLSGEFSSAMRHAAAAALVELVKIGRMAGGEVRTAAGVPVLVGLLSDVCATLRVYAVRTLYEMMRTAEADEVAGETSVEVVLAANGMPPLLSLMAADHVADRANDAPLMASCVLGLFATLHPRAFCDAGGVEPLATFLWRRLREAHDKDREELALRIENFCLADRVYGNAVLDIAVAGSPSLFVHDQLAPLLSLLRGRATARLQHHADAVENGDLMNRDAAALRSALAVATRAGVARDMLRRVKLLLRELEAENAQQARRDALGVGGIALPDEFVCPITYCKMVDPVVASDGQSYERSAIQQVLDSHDEIARSPLTRETLEPLLYPNIALRKRILSHASDELRVAEAAAAAGGTAAPSEQASRKRDYEQLKLSTSSDEGSNEDDEDDESSDEDDEISEEFGYNAPMDP